MKYDKIKDILIEYESKLLAANFMISIVNNDGCVEYQIKQLRENVIFTIKEDVILNRFGTILFAIDISFYYRDQDEMFLFTEYKGIRDFLDELTDLYEENKYE